MDLIDRLKRKAQLDEATRLGLLVCIPGAVLWLSGVVYASIATSKAHSETAVGSLYYAPQLADWITVFGMFGVLLAGGFVVVLYFTSWIIEQANYTEQRAKERIQEAQRAIITLEAGQVELQLEKAAHSEQITMLTAINNSLRLYLDGAQEEASKARRRVRELERAIEVMQGIEFCPLDSDPHRAAVVRYMLACGRSQAEIEVALYGYTGGQAYHTVKRLMGKSTR